MESLPYVQHLGIVFLYRLTCSFEMEHRKGNCDIKVYMWVLKV